MKTNKNKQVRLDDEMHGRVSELVKRSGLTESDILRLALRAGLPKLESGEQNPFAEGFGKESRANGTGTAPILLPEKMKKSKKIA